MKIRIPVEFTVLVLSLVSMFGAYVTWVSLDAIRVDIERLRGRVSVLESRVK